LTYPNLSAFNSVSISRTSNDDYLHVFGGYAERSEAHLEQQLDFALGLDNVQTELVDPASDAFLPGFETSPLFFEPLYSVNLHGPPGGGNLYFGLTDNFTSGDSYNANNGIQACFPGVPLTQNFEPFQHEMNALNDLLPSHFIDTVDFPAEVRDFENEFSVDTQSFQLPIPINQPSSSFNSEFFDLGPQSLGISCSNAPCNTVSEITAESINGSVESCAPDSSIDSTYEPQPLPALHWFPCSLCSRHYVQEEGLRHHMSTAHTKPIIYACGISGCPESGTQFQSEKDLKRHRECVHEAPVTLPCNKILKKRIDNIHRHARTCDVCKNRAGDVNRILGIESGVRKRGRKKKNP